MTPTKRVFIIGGKVQGEFADDQQKYQKTPRQDCYEIVNIKEKSYGITSTSNKPKAIGDDMTNSDSSIPPNPAAFEVDIIDTSTHKQDEKVMKAVVRASMHHPRYCFGYTTLEYGRFIVVVGGAHEDYKHIAHTEFYDVQKNHWLMLPKLNEEKFSPTVVSVKDQYLYAIGGSVKDGNLNKPVITVERVNFNEYLLSSLVKEHNDYNKFAESQMWEKLSISV